MKLQFFAAALGAAFLLVSANPGGAQATGGSPGKMNTMGSMKMTGGGPHELTITLDALNASGESGKAVLKDTAAHGVSVAITLTGAPKGVAQPAHIHKGTCAKLDPKPEFPLTNVMNGKSNTVVPNTSIAKLMASPNAINVHKSAAELKTYVSCGDIAKHKGAM